MARLLGLGALRLTPVVIARELQWLPAEQPATDRDALLARLQSWNQARLQDDEALLRSHYSERFERDNIGLDPWWVKLQIPARSRPTANPLELLSALRWQDDEDLMVVTWLDPNRSTRQRKEYLRTYWTREGTVWKIIFEGPV
jgi:hypothetical protein